MTNMYEILSENLIRLRKSRNLTQAEFADIIKYSDKSVSKWETGMSVPNLETIVDIADFYGITVDDLIRKPVDSEKVMIVEKIKKNNQLFILLLSIAAVWFFSTAIFASSIILGKNPQWKMFVHAVPISFALCTVFSAIWNKKFLFVSLSCFIWTLISSIYIQLLPNYNYYLLFVVGAPIQVIIVLCRGLSRDVAEGAAEKQTEMLKRRLERQRIRLQKRKNRKNK